MIDELIHLSAGMNEDGGGTAHLGRLSGRAMRRFCAHRGLRFSGLHLPSADGGVALDGYHSFAGSKVGIAAALLARLAATPGRKAIFADHIGPARVLGLLPRALLPRYAVQLHGIEIWRELSRDRQRVLSNATFLVANSRYTANRVLDHLKAKVDIRVVLLGIEPAREVGRGHARTLDAAGTGYVLIVGRVAGHERLQGARPAPRCLAGAPAALPRRPTRRRRLRLRPPAPARQGGRARSQDAVFFTGQIDPATLGELYRRAAVFAMPSLLEGFGLVFVEAMAAARACVACAGTAPAEIVVDGETGLLVSPERSLVAALEALLQDPETTRAMGAAGRKRYEAEFSAEAYEARLRAGARQSWSPSSPGRR